MKRIMTVLAYVVLVGVIAVCGAANAAAATLRIIIEARSDNGQTVLQSATINVSNTNDVARLQGAFGNVASIKDRILQTLITETQNHERSVVRERLLRELDDATDSVDQIKGQ